jgi:hypothetical protein
VPPNARACPQCGADERSGWDEEATRYDGLDLPAEAFDPDEGARSRPAGGGGTQIWWVVTAGLILLMLLALLFR